MTGATTSTIFVTGAAGFIGTALVRIRRVPGMAARLAVGPVLADDFRADAVFSNIRLRGTSFRFTYPTRSKRDSSRSSERFNE